jgi:hypothetical protein
LNLGLKWVTDSISLVSCVWTPDIRSSPSLSSTDSNSCNKCSFTWNMVKGPRLMLFQFHYDLVVLIIHLLAISISQYVALFWDMICWVKFLKSKIWARPWLQFPVHKKLETVIFLINIHTTRKYKVVYIDYRRSENLRRTFQLILSYTFCLYSDSCSLLSWDTNCELLCIWVVLKEEAASRKQDMVSSWRNQLPKWHWKK